MTEKKQTINVKSINKNFDNIQALKDICFTTKQGDIIALLGPNGAGKSTLMNIITGYLSPSSGNVDIFEKSVLDFPMEAKKSIGFLSEGAPLYPDMTVIKFLNYMAELRGFSAKEKKDEISRIIKMAKIENIINQKIETLSKGYTRRVGFAQSIIGNPPILLLDEPTDGLDPNQKEHIRSLICQMGQEKTIIISTHLLEEAETICNRIILISKGKIVADGTLSEILKQTKTKSLSETFRKLTKTEEK